MDSHRWIAVLGVVSRDLRANAKGGLNCVHVTIAYHENTRETLTRMGEWNQRFESMPDLIRPVHNPSDIALAKAEGRIGIIFGAQNCSPIEDEIRWSKLCDGWDS